MVIHRDLCAPMVNRSPGKRLDSVTRCPCRKIPFFEPRSRKTSVPSTAIRVQCRWLAQGSRMWTSAFSSRPKIAGKLRRMIRRSAVQCSRMTSSTSMPSSYHRSPACKSFGRRKPVAPRHRCEIASLSATAAKNRRSPPEIPGGPLSCSSTSEGRYVPLSQGRPLFISDSLPGYTP